YFVAILCVIGIAAGQILFKLSARSLANSGSFFSYETLPILLSAFALYGVTTIAWIWVLQKIELSKAYPCMALAFVMVPIGSWLFLNEKISIQYYVGIAFIIFGIVIATRSN
ncbi:EamA family transporter, partial [Salmonella enterica]|nr:EamA family transporter [Salmonella enterica]